MLLRNWRSVFQKLLNRTTEQADVKEGTLKNSLSVCRFLYNAANYVMDMVSKTVRSYKSILMPQNLVSLRAL